MTIIECKGCVESFVYLNINNIKKCKKILKVHMPIKSKVKQLWASNVRHISFPEGNEGGREIRPWTNQYIFRCTGSLQNLSEPLRSYSEPLNFVPNPATVNSCICYLFYQFILSLNSLTNLYRRGLIQEMLICCPQNFKQLKSLNFYVFYLENLNWFFLEHIFVNIK